MTLPLAAALSELEARLGAEGAAPGVRRVEVRAGELTLELGGALGPRWFRFHAGELRELDPRDDERLPVCTLRRDVVARSEVLAWRPGRRMVLRTPANGRAHIVKAYRAGRAERARANHERVLAASGPQLRPPRLVGFDPQACTLELELLDATRPGIREEDAHLWFGIGYALRRFQERAATRGLEVHDRGREHGVLSELAARTAGVTAMDAGWERAFGRLGETRPVRARRAVVLHRDLHDKQILVSAGQSAWIDFDLLCAGDPLLDAANLTAHLKLRVLQGVQGATESGATACARAFLEGLDRSSGERGRRELRCWQAGTFLRLALVYALRPRWGHLVPSLVDLANRCLDEAG